jgi:hypothetical protein
MRKLKYSNKINQETVALSEMINTYVKKMNKEYVSNMNKLVELIARGENLEVTRLKTKYLGLFKSTPDNENNEVDLEETVEPEEKIIDTLSSDISEVYLDKVLIADSEYWYEKKENGNIYYNNVVVGCYKNNIFEINGKKYNNKLATIN